MAAAIPTRSAAARSSAARAAALTAAAAATSASRLRAAFGFASALPSYLLRKFPDAVQLYNIPQNGPETDFSRREPAASTERSSVSRAAQKRSRRTKPEEEALNDGSRVVRDGG